MTEIKIGTILSTFFCILYIYCIFKIKKKYILQNVPIQTHLSVPDIQAS